MTRVTPSGRCTIQRVRRCDRSGKLPRFADGLALPLRHISKDGLGRPLEISLTTRLQQRRNGLMRFEAAGRESTDVASAFHRLHWEAVGPLP